LSGSHFAVRQIPGKLAQRREIWDSFVGRGSAVARIWSRNCGLRFYLPSIRRGCVSEYGEVPPRIAAALAAVEHAADDVSEVVPTQEGSLLIASNWFALHDRVRQTISRTRENREALLCFVAHQGFGAVGPG
jgi:hypothetical protein